MLLIANLMLAANVAQPPTPSAFDSDPIVIVGERQGATMLVVDVREVAVKCRACRKEIERLEGLAKPYVRLRGEYRRDTGSTIETFESHNRPTGYRQSPLALAAKADRLQLIWEAAFGRQGREVNAARAAFGQQVGDYLRALAPHIVTIAEAERQRLGASGVVNSRRAKTGKARRIDITADVIRQLDQKELALDTAQ